MTARGAAGHGGLRRQAERGIRAPHPGGSLLAKLSGSAMGMAGGGSASREGWHTPSCSGVAGAVSSPGCLRRPALPGKGGGGRGDHLPEGSHDLPDIGGAGDERAGPGRPRGEEAAAGGGAEPQALAAGESVTVEYRLDGRAVGRSWGCRTWTGQPGRAMALSRRGQRCRVLGLRVTLESGSTAAGPSLTGLSLEYAERPPAVKRHWQLDARCEGVPGAMLRLLDGSTETSSGAQLSAAAVGCQGQGDSRPGGPGRDGLPGALRGSRGGTGRAAPGPGGPDGGQVQLAEY